MGRPVFHEFSLDDLVRGSSVTALVDRLEPRLITAVRDGVTAALWPVTVVELLHFNEEPVRGTMSLDDLAPPPLPPQAGERLEVLVNRVAMTDAGNRLRSSSGASFPAERYRSDPRAAEAARCVVFLKDCRGAVELTTDGAYELVERLTAIGEAIARCQADLPARKALRAELRSRPGRRA